MLNIIIALIIIGGLLYLLQFLPIDATIKRAIQVIAIVLLAVWALREIWPMTGIG